MARGRWRHFLTVISGQPCLIASHCALEQVMIAIDAIGFIFVEGGGSALERVADRA